jgi:NAD(P)-dependent dehydrogenase (short-subunit alcohol dehydrogenase family)
MIDNDHAELENTIELLSRSYKLSHDFSYSECELTDADAVRAAVATAANFFFSTSHSPADGREAASEAGRLDVLINNAADTSGAGQFEFATLPLDVWRRSLATNLTAPMLLSQLCLPLLTKARRREGYYAGGGAAPGGVIVNMSSTRAVMSEANNEAYAVTKAGLLGLTQAMAVSLGPRYGVRVNAILPGWIHVAEECREADELGRRWEEGLTREDHAWHLTGRVGRVEDVWRAVEALVENEGMTGAEVVVDGGVTRKMVYPIEE